MIEPAELRIASPADLELARTQARRFAEELGLPTRERVSLSLAVDLLGAQLLEGSGGSIILSVDEVEDSRGEAQLSLCLRVEPSHAQPLSVVIDVIGPEITESLSVALGLDARVRDGAVCFERILPPGHAPGPSSSTAARYSALDDLLFLIEQLNWQDRQVVSLTRELDDTNRGVLALYDELEDRANRLRVAQETQKRFMAHLTHEFRTPLSAMQALTGILLSRYDGDLTPEQEKQIVLIRSSAVDLNQLVDDLLDFAKMQAGAESIRIAAVDVPALFRTLRGLLRPLDTRPEVALVFEEPAGVPEMATDDRKLAQILRNLISNALKFTERGEVRVAARTSSDGGRVLFSVADTGIGIPLEAQAHIFDEYMQVESSLQGQIKGTGLGLPLSQRLAELLGGTLSVQSAPQEGSTFTADIPVIAPESAAAAGHIEAEGATTSAQDSGSGQTAPSGEHPTAEKLVAQPLILNVNDSEASRYAKTRMLLRGGFNVIEAANGMQALQMAREHPDLVLLDVKMPDINGFEVCRRLKADPATAPIPVIYLSATYRDSTTIVEGLDTGGDGYLTEPVEPEVLLASVRAALRARRAEALAASALARLAAVLAAVREPVCLIDRDGVVERANEAMSSALAAPSGSIEGLPCAELFGGEMAGAFSHLRATLAPVEAVIRGRAAASGVLTAVVDDAGVFEGAVLTLAT